MLIAKEKGQLYALWVATWPHSLVHTLVLPLMTVQAYRTTQTSTPYEKTEAVKIPYSYA